MRNTPPPPVPLAWVNDRWVPADEATVPVTDRSFLYGDGLFETVRLAGGRPFLWGRHWSRFAEGLDALGLPRPGTGAAVRRLVETGALRQGLSDGVVRLHRSRGSGSRGYSPADATRPAFIITFHPLPTPRTRPVSLRTASLPLPPPGPMTRHKTASRLVWVLARMEAESAGADEALLVDAGGRWVEAASANLGWLEAGRICTPPVSAGALPGITRDLVRRLAREVGRSWAETPGDPERVLRAEAVFLTGSVAGVVPVGSIDGQPVGDPAHLAPLQAAHHARLRRFAGRPTVAVRPMGD